MNAPLRSPAPSAPCGPPVDSEFFDVAGFADWPPPAGEATLARFDLPHQYCGIVECFSQFTDSFFEKPSHVRTPDVEWRLLVNGRPLHPYVNVRAILNPWGVGGFCVRLRLPEAAEVELVARLVLEAPASSTKLVGGRISGRYWYAG